MSRGAQQLDELYNQLLNSFDTDGPDLNLISPVAGPGEQPRAEVARKHTGDSDKILDLYQSYTDRPEVATRSDNVQAVRNSSPSKS